MTFKGEMALILRYFTEFGSFRGALRKDVIYINKLLLDGIKLVSVLF